MNQISAESVSAGAVSEGSPSGKSVSGPVSAADGRRSMLSVRISLSEKEVLVIGSKGAAALLAEYLSSRTGHLTVLSRCPSEPLREICRTRRIPLLEKSYEREDLHGADYVFCASSCRDIIRDVSAVCRTMGILLYTAGRPDKSDFLLDEQTEEAVARVL